jgi:hypothetical protein
MRAVTSVRKDVVKVEFFADETAANADDPLGKGRAEKAAHGLVGQVVDADEWVGPDIDHAARHVVGVLEVRHVETLGYDRFSVNGLGVTPESVKPHEPENGGGPHAG